MSGYLVKVNFKDGDIVKEDDLLYQIDPRPFQADLDQAKGNVERLEAEKKLLAIQVDRYRKLAEKGAGSQQDLDQYLAQQAENIGALKSAQAQVEQAELNLGFTRIAAPIAGKISRTLLTVGNLVNADSTLLTTLMSIDPMYAYFNVEEPTLLRSPQDDPRGRHQVADLDEVAGADGAGRRRRSGSSRCTARSTSSTTRSIRRPARSWSAARSPTRTAARAAAAADARAVRPRPPGHRACRTRRCWSPSGPSAPTRDRNTSTSSTRTTRSPIAASSWDCCSTACRRSKRG